MRTMVNLQWILGILSCIQVLLEEEGLIYQDKASNVENFLQSMDALCLFPPLSFATTTPSWSQWWCVDMDSGMRSWGLSLFWEVCSGITLDFLTLSVTSRWNGSTTDKQNGQLYTSVPIVFYSSHFSLCLHRRYHPGHPDVLASHICRSLPFSPHTWSSACIVAKLGKREVRAEKYNKGYPHSGAGAEL